MNKRLGILLIILLIILGIVLGLWWKVDKNNGNQQVKEKVWKSGQTVNEPILLEGMKAIGFEEGKEVPIILKEEEKKEGIWYQYIAQEATTENGGTSKWANAMTLDGSIWVWIPRYAYKIEWDESQNVGKIDIVFLEGNTNYDKDGKDVTTLGYKVHPAFTDGKNNNYNNGEWDREITGIWVSKFEAGYAGQKNTASENVKIINTNLQYQRNTQNVLGKVTKQKTYMTYPVFMGKTYSYNNIEVGEMYDLSQELNQEENPYGFDKTVDSHLMKNSEWGATAYLAHSKYGRNGTKVSINNMDVSEAVYACVTVTGYAGNTTEATANVVESVDTKLKDNYNNKSYAWYTEKGKLASTTGNLYGIYDMNGGSSEYTAGYITGINQETGHNYADSLLKNNNSTKYCTVYHTGGKEATLVQNYEANKDVYGDAIIETSKSGSGYTSWFGETSIYIYENSGFFLRSGSYDKMKYSGLFDFTHHSGHSIGSYSFRCVLIENR